MAGQARLALTTQDIGNVFGITREEVQGVVRSINKERRADGGTEIRLKRFKYMPIAPDDCKEIGRRIRARSELVAKGWMSDNAWTAVQFSFSKLSEDEQRTFINRLLKGSIKLEAHDVKLV